MIYKFLMNLYMVIKKERPQDVPFIINPFTQVYYSVNNGVE